ncbi:phage baseplate assembly protein V [Flavobacterium oreochromis]|uniref:Gp5/Type VI secretion system Vgr protein OB-fold domain-containing protein n=2 Tax=Flavobacterium TaxID=237 RepID=A0A246GCM3_9FLAO|nr:phage baseplate assembly protein V [Flavobacterium oreochromis]OWP78879.1 hypothetical protein BWK62_03700 [Flavobacterium oreochromis]
MIVNNNPMGMGRVRVQFPWQEKKNQKTPWIRLIQPHSGAGKGFHFIPEIGEEVLVGFENGNAEKPFVLGTHYNGSETSGYHTPGNDIKAIHTRSGHILKFTEDESIIITDQSGNTIQFDTVGSNITITAPETMSFNCKNMLINVSQNMITNVGMNVSESTGMNKTETIGGTKNTVVLLDMISNVRGSLTEVIEGDVNTESKNERNEIVGGKVITQSQKDTELHTPAELKKNAAEKTNTH